MKKLILIITFIAASVLAYSVGINSSKMFVRSNVEWSPNHIRASGYGQVVNQADVSDWKTIYYIDVFINPWTNSFGDQGAEFFVKEITVYKNTITESELRKLEVTSISPNMVAAQDDVHTITVTKSGVSIKDRNGDMVELTNKKF